MVCRRTSGSSTSWFVQGFFESLWVWAPQGMYIVLVNGKLWIPYLQSPILSSLPGAQGPSPWHCLSVSYAPKTNDFPTIPCLVFPGWVALLWRPLWDSLGAGESVGGAKESREDPLLVVKLLMDLISFSIPPVHQGGVWLLPLRAVRFFIIYWELEWGTYSYLPLLGPKLFHLCFRRPEDSRGDPWQYWGCSHSPSALPEVPGAKQKWHWAWVLPQSAQGALREGPKIGLEGAWAWGPDKSQK